METNKLCSTFPSHSSMLSNKFQFVIGWRKQVSINSSYTTANYSVLWRMCVVCQYIHHCPLKCTCNTHPLPCHIGYVTYPTVIIWRSSHYHKELALQSQLWLEDVCCSMGTPSSRCVWPTWSQSLPVLYMTRVKLLLNKSQVHRVGGKSKQRRWLKACLHSRF